MHSRCDLACDHCYVYEHADQSWRTRPRAMAVETVRAAGKRIAEHAADHRLGRVQVILHGGEPLLLGRARLDAVLTELAATIAPVARLDLRMQSNGVLLTPAICDVLVRHRVRVGISLDGDRAANDRHRLFATGASSHDRVLRALALLRRTEYRSAYAGILCTVDVDNDPVRVYEALVAQQPPRIDFLLPHATWDSPPPRPAGDPTPYASWLGRIHDRWTADGRPVPIRLFDSLASTVVGGPSGTEAVGLDPADLVVIETDGAWEQADSLKTAYDGAPGTGFDVFSHSVDEVAAHPGIAIRQSGLAGVCETCRACPVVHRCGGGLFAHRYRTGSGFDNPSVYCADLKSLIARMDGMTRHPMSDRILDDIGSGYGEADTVEHLVAAQVPITRVLLSMVGETASGSAAWELLERVDTEAPEAVAAVLAHPYVRAWAVRYLEGAEPADRAHLAGVAAAAAIRAGMSADLEIPVRDGMVHLPTLGAFTLAKTGTTTLSISDGSFELRAEKADWWPIRRLDLAGRSVPIEDTDPYRDCHEWPVAGRLAPAEAESWQRAVNAAWLGIRRDAPGQAAGVRGALRALLPLRASDDGQQRSATNRNAFGAVALALGPAESGAWRGATGPESAGSRGRSERSEPAGSVAGPDADALALLLVHEIQHVKLGAVLDVCDLVDGAYHGLLDVPWRRDKRRPVEAALQGAYAHLGVADVWRARGRAGGPDAGAARAHFRRYRDWVSGTVDAILRTRALTPDGERFVGRMRQTMETWRDDDD
ncbi:FxsB family cyclophane-forming radical SAM/SPASM peptide maturase [Phytohabitans rumicis]|uniref:FxsB family cyclophane-forming radical SAM/SPASM peptide maturase n=1 Tax=Phytohabitans rumicis TaxID=1076125 RepID=UPI003CD05513